MKSRWHKGFDSRLALLGLAVTIFSIPEKSCQRIEFEPAGRIYITTDSIHLLADGSVRMVGSVLSLGREEIVEHGFCWSDSGAPTSNGPSTRLGPLYSEGMFYSNVYGLQPKKIYYIKAYAISPDKVVYGNERSVRTPSPPIDSFITDVDGNTYPVVKIGEQTWMAENLRTTHYADSTPIPLVETDEDWSKVTGIDRAYSWYNNNPANSEIYGAYYSWAAAMKGVPGSTSNPSGVQGVCPGGWHLPSDDEWNQMHISLGMRPGEADNIGFIGTRASVGNKMKGFGYPLWEGYEEDYNASGFTALPCGLRTNSGGFDNVGKYAYYWSATDFSGLEAWCRSLQREHSAVLREHLGKSNGFSVRCVLDD